MEIVKIIVGGLTIIALTIGGYIAFKYAIDKEIKITSKKLELDERRVKALETIADAYNQLHI